MRLANDSIQAGSPATMSAGEAATIGAYTHSIANALAQKGIDHSALFHAAGLDDHYANDPMRRVPVSKLTRLFKLCVEATGDPFFGLAVAGMTHPSSLHALGYSLMTSHTLMDFSRRIERYFGLLSDVARVRVDIEGDRVALVTTNVVETCAETQDTWLALVVRFVRMLTRDEVDPLHVAFIHPIPNAGAGPYQAYFRCPVSFGNPENVLVFDRVRFTQPLEGSCPELAQFNDTIAADYIARLDRSDMVARVRGTIVARLESDECDRDTIARDLGMAPATLARKLALRGSSFHDILNDTRRELAIGYLLRADLSVTEIAFRLGFTDQSNFTRAFKRWTGQSPSEFRTGTAAN